MAFTEVVTDVEKVMIRSEGYVHIEGMRASVDGKPLTIVLDDEEVYEFINKLQNVMADRFLKEK